MKRYILLTALLTVGLFTTVIYTSCTKDKDSDKCKSVVCSNGGVCKDGACSCPPDFTGANCEKLACEVNNTAKVRFSNRSIASTYEVIWDGRNISVIGPGVTTNYLITNAGQHTLAFKYQDSTNNACTQVQNVQQCGTAEYYCTK